MKFYVIISTCLLLIATVDIEARRKRESEFDPICRETVISGDFSNLTVKSEAIRKLVTDYWNSEAVPKDLSSEARLLIEKVLARNETDSYQQLKTMYYFTISSHVFFSQAEDNPGLCFLATVANGSTIWDDCGDGRLALKSIYDVQAYRLGWCMSTIVDSLKRGGCKKLPTVNVQSLSNCYEKGRVYEIDKTLEYYGKDLPCCFIDLIYHLYYSDLYYDNLLCATFASTLNILTDDVLSLFPVDVQLELLYALIEPKDKPCCCKKRRERFTYLCHHVNKTGLDPAIEKYASTECPPDAAYLK